MNEDSLSIEQRAASAVAKINRGQPNIVDKDVAAELDRKILEVRNVERPAEDPAMDGAGLLHHAASTIAHCDRKYGKATDVFAHIAARWSLVLGITVTPAQVALMMIDLKMARLTLNPDHLDSIVDVAGYAACLRDVTKGDE